MIAVGEYPSILPAEPSQAVSTPPRVVAILSSVLEKLVARNDQLLESLSLSLSLSQSQSQSQQLGERLKGFHGVRAPSISIPKYLERIYKYTNCSPSCLVVGYVYIDRLVHKHPDCLVVSFNVHRLLVTSVMVASKMLDDEPKNHNCNAFFARVGGISNAELNRLEMELLFMLDFRVTVSTRVFESYCFHLEREMLMMSSSIGTSENLKIDNALSNGATILEDVSEMPLEETQQPSYSFSSPT